MLSIDDFEIIKIDCLVNFGFKPSIMDKRFQFVEEFAQEFPEISYTELPPMLSVRSAGGERSITIRADRWEYSSRSLESIEDFADQVIDYLRRFCEITQIKEFEGIGLRVNYNHLLESVQCSPPEFPYLKDFFDIPGIEDERIADLIHYNVSVQRAGKRFALTLGQFREKEIYFLRPILELYEFHSLGLDNVKDKLIDFYRSLVKGFERYLKKNNERSCPNVE